MNTPNSSFSHIPGWGSDLGRRGGTHGADPLPMVIRDPVQQADTVEVLVSSEHQKVTPVFGTTVPPTGISGMVRRAAFKFSENDLRHWLLLLFADRVNVGEGLVSDVAHGHVPNLVGEMGARAEWRHNKRGLVKKVAVATLVIGTVVLIRSRRRG